MKRGSVMQLINEVTKHKPIWANSHVIDDAIEEYDYLIDRVGALETALQCANVCNNILSSHAVVAWDTNSPFQKKIEELVGKPPYGDKDE